MRKIVIVCLIVIVAIITAYICRSRFHHKTMRPASLNSGCLANLRAIDAGENEWALENHKTTNDTPTWDDLRGYLEGGKIPQCPQGGTYKLGHVGEVPTCSIGGPRHSLP
jgi:hypothetical protein